MHARSDGPQFRSYNQTYSSVYETALHVNSPYGVANTAEGKLDFIHDKRETGERIAASSAGALSTGVKSGRAARKGPIRARRSWNC